MKPVNQNSIHIKNYLFTSMLILSTSLQFFWAIFVYNLMFIYLCYSFLLFCIFSIHLPIKGIFRTMQSQRFHVKFSKAVNHYEAYNWTIIKSRAWMSKRLRDYRIWRFCEYYGFWNTKYIHLKPICVYTTNRYNINYAWTFPFNSNTQNWINSLLCYKNTSV